MTNTDPTTLLSAFSGYITLYSFQNPFAGTRVRICQALILPSFQRRGLGRELMWHVYNIVYNRPEVSEITVEDPCPGFQALRYCDKRIASWTNKY